MQKFMNKLIILKSEISAEWADLISNHRINYQNIYIKKY